MPKVVDTHILICDFSKKQFELMNWDDGTTSVLCS